MTLDGARERTTAWIGLRKPPALLYGAIITGLWHRFATAMRNESAVLLAGIPAVGTMHLPH